MSKVQRGDIPEPEILMSKFRGQDAIIHYDIHVVKQIPADKLQQVELLDIKSLIEVAKMICPVDLTEEGVSVTISLARNGKGTVMRFEDGDCIRQRDF